MKKNYSRVCIEDSAYSLFLYFLISSKAEIDSTYYFFSNGVPYNIYQYFQGQSHYFNPRYYKEKRYLRLLSKFWLRLTANFYWPFLQTANIYGLEICAFSPGLMGKRKIVSIEDSLSNYIVVERKVRLPKLKALLFGAATNAEFPGRDFQCVDKVILTGLCETGYPTHISTEFINIQKKWDESTDEKKKLILDIYNISEADLKELMQRDEILITQTLSEDGVITENEKITFYRQLLQGRDCSKILIKPHPREMTDYKKYFPDIYVFEKKVPMQLLNVLGVKYKKVYTICSTAAFSFSSDTEIVFLGSECHPNILQKCGVIKMPYKKYKN